MCAQPTMWLLLAPVVCDPLAASLEAAVLPPLCFLMNYKLGADQSAIIIIAAAIIVAVTTTISGMGGHCSVALSAGQGLVVVNWYLVFGVQSDLFNVASFCTRQGQGF